MAASWMEAAQMPLRELRKKYTKSEMAIAGWRGAEMAANMREQRIAPAANAQHARAMAEPMDEIERQLEEKIGSFAHELVDENGEVDLRRVSGDKALRYMNAIGCAARRRTWGG